MAPPVRFRNGPYVRMLPLGVLLADDVGVLTIPIHALRYPQQALMPGFVAQKFVLPGA
jgi:hypothetical protein